MGGVARAGRRRSFISVLKVHRRTHCLIKRKTGLLFQKVKTRSTGKSAKREKGEETLFSTFLPTV